MSRLSSGRHRYSIRTGYSSPQHPILLPLLILACEHLVAVQISCRLVEVSPLLPLRGSAVGSISTARSAAGPRPSVSWISHRAVTVTVTSLKHAPKATEAGHVQIARPRVGPHDMGEYTGLSSRHGPSVSQLSLEKRASEGADNHRPERQDSIPGGFHREAWAVRRAGIGR